MNGAVGRDQLSLAVRSAYSAGAPDRRGPAAPDRTGLLGKDRLQLSSRPGEIRSRSRAPLARPDSAVRDGQPPQAPQATEEEATSGAPQSLAGFLRQQGPRLASILGLKPSR